jgi:hypothetical protein
VNKSKPFKTNWSVEISLFKYYFTLPITILNAKCDQITTNRCQFNLRFNGNNSGAIANALLTGE